MSIPVIDISALVHSASPEDRKAIVNAIGEACMNVGFFYIVNHGVDESLISNLSKISKDFFAKDEAWKRLIDMKDNGKAWRGYFGVGDEVTSGIPDQKEGIYFGSELSNDDPRPLHGANVFPPLIPELSANEVTINNMREIVTLYMSEMAKLGRILMCGIAESLGLNENVFGSQFIHPTQLFRIFNYPPHNEDRFGLFGEKCYGVGEHTDYGFITILNQDESGGLQVKDLRIHASSGGDGEHCWIDAPYIKNSFVINLGDALEHATGGLYRATPHRVERRVGARNDRISFPYFFDPSFESPMVSLVDKFPDDLRAKALTNQQESVFDRNLKRLKAEQAGQPYTRWDGQDVKLFSGTYGQYLLRKVAKAFPDLAEDAAILS